MIRQVGLNIEDLPVMYFRTIRSFGRGMISRGVVYGRHQGRN